MHVIVKHACRNVRVHSNMEKLADNFGADQNKLYTHFEYVTNDRLPDERNYIHISLNYKAGLTTKCILLYQNQIKIQLQQERFAQKKGKKDGITIKARLVAKDWLVGWFVSFMVCQPFRSFNGKLNFNQFSLK